MKNICLRFSLFLSLLFFVGCQPFVFKADEYNNKNLSQIKPERRDALHPLSTSNSRNGDVWRFHNRESSISLPDQYSDQLMRGDD